MAATLPPIMYSMFAWFSGRTNRRKRSASSIEEDLRDFRINPLFRPIRMLVPNACSLHFTSEPVKFFCQKQSFLTGNGTQCGDLFRARAFVTKHGYSVVENVG